MANPLQKSPESWLERQLPEEEVKSPFFTIEKQQGARAVNIDFQFENGDRLALPCSDLRKIEFNASKGICLLWTDETIWIIGRNLIELYQYLVRHRVNAIIEDGGEELAEDALVITELVREDESI